LVPGSNPGGPTKYMSKETWGKYPCLFFIIKNIYLFCLSYRHTNDSYLA